MTSSALPNEEIFGVTGALRSAAAQAARRGTLRRVVHGVYTRDLTTPLEILVATRLHEVVAAIRPGALIADRSARLGGRPTADGLVFLVHPVTPDVKLPGGLTLRSRRGPGPVATDISLPHGLWMSSEARTALENLTRSRSRNGKSSRTLGRAEVEVWLDNYASRAGDEWIRRLREQAREIAPRLGLEEELELLDGILGTLLGTRAANVVSPQLRSRARGEAYDSARAQTFDVLAGHLASSAPPVPIPVPAAPRTLVLPFVEAYFSNFIEGTEFAFQEASAIVYDGISPANRPADAHDVRGTYAIVADEAEMRRTPASADDLVRLIEARHAVLLGGRPEKRPGEFKERGNQAGATSFVEPRLVAGTLRQGFERYARLDDPFARATFMMFLITEVHPFDDGNGRLARVMANAELVSADLARIVIPTIYRNNYVMALKGLTINANARSFVATLRFAQRYTAQLDCSNIGAAQAVLNATGAFVDATEADLTGRVLVLPSSLGQPE